LAWECHARVVGSAGKKLREKGPSEGDWRWPRVSSAAPVTMDCSGPPAPTFCTRQAQILASHAMI
jgi:hypothetical protein